MTGESAGKVTRKATADRSMSALEGYATNAEGSTLAATLPFQLAA